MMTSCLICGVRFVPRRTQRTCSNVCRRERARQKDADARQSPWRVAHNKQYRNQHREEIRQYLRDRYAVRKAASVLPKRTCVICGLEVMASTTAVTCSDSCRKIRRKTKAAIWRSTSPKHREWMEQSRDKRNAKARERNQKNPEKYRENNKRYAERHPDRIKETQRKYRERNRKKIREYLDQNRDKINARMRENRLLLRACKDIGLVPLSPLSFLSK